MTKKKSINKWVIDERKDFIVRLYISAKTEKTNKQSLCMKVIKMPKRLMKHHCLITKRIPMLPNKIYSIRTGWGPNIELSRLTLADNEERANKPRKHKIYNGIDNALASYAHFSTMIKELGGQVIGQEERLTNDPDKEEKLKMKKMRQRIKKPKKIKIFSKKSLVSFIDNIEQEKSKLSTENKSDVKGADIN